MFRARSLQAGALILVFAPFLGLLAGCQGRSGATGGVLRVHLNAEPASLDPALTEDGASLKILGNTMDGLVGYDASGRLQDRLAESHQVSPDGRRYEFRLRPLARWSDGKRVEPSDFVTGFRRALSPGSGSKLAGMLFPIRGARAYFEGKATAEALAVRADGDRLVIELERPAPYFVQVLSLTVALPSRQDLLDLGGGKWPAEAPSTGPYRIASRSQDEGIRLEPNPYYWSGSPPRGPVEVRIVSDESTALNLFEQGGLDVLTRVPASELPRLRARGVIRTDPYLATFYLSFNLKKPPFNDRVWRQAVAGSIRREELVRALDSGDMPARSWVPPGLEGHIPYADPAPVFGKARAAARAKGSPKEALTAGFDTSGRNTMIMEKVQHDLKDALRLKFALTNLDWKTYLKTLQSDPPSLFRLGMLSPFMDPIQLLVSFTTGDPNNYLKWSDPAYDRLVGEISALAPGPERAARIIEAQKVLVEREAVVVPLYHYVQNHAVAPRVTGFRVNPFGVIRFDELGVK